MLCEKTYCHSRLHGKVAIITGASKGIGRGISKVFASEGAKVVLVSRTEADLKKVTNDIKSAGGEASYVVADVSKAQDMENMAAEVLQKHGRIDILIHNAGIYSFVRFEDMDLDQWNNIIETNLTSSFHVAKACLPAMKKQKNGRIIFTSSISGPRVGLPGASHYTASKGGMNGFMHTLAIELAKYNITVNAVEPGNIMSEGFDMLGDEHKKRILAAIPMGRLGVPEDIAYADVFLASDEAQYITGQSIIVDGGQVLPESHHMEY
ncbi:MAG: SDR family oxidoreductase [Proteobacteria bacterium]|nr:SDR family oxidoreductase [Pseudomonadota bacterium]